MTYLPAADPVAAVSAPALLRGTVSASRWPGVTLGAGGTSASRQATLAGLQAAVNSAATNGRFFEIEPGLYEIEGAAGLLIPRTKNSGFVWRGTKASHIKQYGNNCPVITIGDTATSGNTTEQAVVEGFRASYATDQSANTASTAVVIGLARNCTFSEWNVFADSTATGWPAGASIRAYRGIRTQHATDTMTYFSNSMRDVMIGGAQQNLLDMAGGGTGNVFSNIYCANGVTGSPQAIADYPIRLRGAADLYEGVYQQINVEWCIAQYLVFCEIARNATFASWHLEGNRLTGADPAVFNLSNAQINLSGLDILDMEVLAASATGTPSVFRTYGACAVSGHGVALNWSGAGRVDRSFNLVNVTSFSPSDAPVAVNVSGLVTRDVAGGNWRNLQLDANTPNTAFPAPVKVDRYRWHEVLPEVTGVSLAPAGDCTVYGCHADATVNYPAALGAARTVTLAGTMKASGALSAVAVPAGALCAVRRGPGTADSFALTVKNLTSGGTTLSTLSAADTVARYRFNGTNWGVVA